MNNKKSDTLPERVEVLLVGNGPVGASMAALLGRFGITTLIIDKTHDVLLMPRAIALDNEALRILQHIGLSEDAFEKLVIPEVRMRCPMVGEFSRANTSGNLDGHPKLVTFYQPDLERALRAHYSTFDNVQCATGMELISLEQTATDVVASIRDEMGNQYSVGAQYVVGADGAKSLVRSLIGQDFEGQSYSENWLIVDAKGRENQAIDHVEFLCDYRRPTPHMPAPGGRERWEFMLHDNESEASMDNPEALAKLLAPWIPVDQLEIERKAVYRFHARCCKAFSKGNIFLIGDAAHITPPFVGQGLVAGLRDAANLAWKLAWVLRERAHPRILDSYDQERRPHAQEMIDLAKFMGKLVMPRNAAGALLSHGLMKLLRMIPSVRRKFEELEIKPKNNFKAGLFARTPSGCELRIGGLFPQDYLRLPNGQLTLSDELLGDNLTLIGFQADPTLKLGTAMRQAWEKHGGHFLRIGLHGSNTDGGPAFAEDLCNTFLNKAPAGSLSVIRPDRIVMDTRSDGDANAIVRQCLKQIGVTV